MKVFVFASSYETRTLLYNIDSIINQKIEVVYLLSENHCRQEKWDFYRFKITLNPNIEECICGSDIILVVPCELDSPQLSCAVTLCQKYHKQYVFLDIKHVLHQDCFDFERFNQLSNTVPFILLLNYGQLSQTYAVEVQINTLLRKNNIKFGQKFSKEAKLVFEKMNNIHLLNNEVSISQNLCAEESEIYILSYDIQDLFLHKNNVHDRIIRTFLSADFVILQSDYLPASNLEIIVKNIENRLNLKIDLIVRSCYYKLQVGKTQYICYRPTISKEHIITKNQNCYMDIEQYNFPESLMNMITTKMAFPKGILPIK